MLAEHAEQGVLVTCPDLRPIGRCIGVSLGAQLLVLVALHAIGLPERQQVAHFVELPRHGQQRCGLLTKAPIGDIEIVLRVLEEHPEVVADDISGDLASADRAANEGAHEVLSVIQHELVSRLGRNRLEGLERIGPVIRAITG